MTLFIRSPSSTLLHCSHALCEDALLIIAPQRSVDVRAAPVHTPTTLCRIAASRLYSDRFIETGLKCNAGIIEDAAQGGPAPRRDSRKFGRRGSVSLAQDGQFKVASTAPPPGALAASACRRPRLDLRDRHGADGEAVARAGRRAARRAGPCD